MSFLILTIKILFSVILVLVFSNNSFAISADEPKSQLPKYDYIEPKNIAEFIDKLNELGKQGYKLKVIERYTYFSPPEDFREIKIAGIIEHFEGDTYEYKWFNTLTLPQFALKANEYTKEGFYFSNIVRYSILDSENITADGSLENSVKIIKEALSQEPEDGSLFILERKNNLRDPTELKIAIPNSTKTSILGTSTLGKKEMFETLEQAIAEIDTRTYQPVAMFLSSTVFKTRISHLETILFQNTWEYNWGGTRPNFKFVKANQFGSTFRKMIDAVASEGFEIVVLGYPHMAMVLETGRKPKYYWLKPGEKNFEQNLANISSEGATFKMNGVDTTRQNILVFEKTSEKVEKRKWYKILKVTNKPRKVKGEREPQITTLAESLEEFKRLQQEGYRACSLFYKDGMNILLEK